MQGRDIEVDVSRRYRIGLVGDLHHLRRPLEASGFTPYGGPLDHHVTTQIETLLRQGPRTPVLVAPDHGDPSWVDWLETLLDADRRVVVLGDLPPRVAATRVRQVALDASLADALHFALRLARKIIGVTVPV